MAGMVLLFKYHVIHFECQEKPRFGLFKTKKFTTEEHGISQIYITQCNFRENQWNN